MYIYKPNYSPANLHKWDFIDPVEYVCSNVKSIDGFKYQCLGHLDGDKLYPTYHGIPENGNRFWIYPRDKPLPDPRWDFYELPCNHCEQ